jgi:tRNA-splicing ligase RtcB
METNYIHEEVPGGVPIKMWTRGVPSKTRPSAS